MKSGTSSGATLWHRHPHVRSGDQLTFGERSADMMRNAFGSWAFVGAFLLFMGFWIILNTVLLGTRGFDKYPYILLNLGLSMMAGLQGALILIAAKRADRVAAEQATAHYAETGQLDAILCIVRDQVADTHTLTKQQMVQLANLAHINAELNVIRAAVAPDALNPSEGIDPAAPQREQPLSRDWS